MGGDIVKNYLENYKIYFVNFKIIKDNEMKIVCFFFQQCWVDDSFVIFDI